MPLSGLVLVTRPDLPLAPLLLALESQQAIDVGDPVGGRIPITLDTPDKASDRELWDWLRARPEVLDVAVALIHLDAGAPAPAAD